MPEAEDIVIAIAGAAGDGSIAAGQILNLAAARMGYHVMNFDSFPAEIRGFGKSVAHTRIGREKALTPGSKVTCLVALDDKHAITELGSLAPNGVVVFDSRPPDYHEEDEAVAGWIQHGMTGFGVPLRELSITATESPKSRNVVALGVLSSLFGLNRDAFHGAIRKRWGKMKPEALEAALKAFDLGYEYAERELDRSDILGFGHEILEHLEDVTIVSGNEAAAQACLDADLRLYAGYPITPATKIMEILAKQLPKQGGVVVQTEDEIAAISHVVGAGFAGKRACTATSGPGLCLMVECLNLAVMAEVPAVVIDCQRGGPSTGLPTKTEQSDLFLAALGASGESPRAVLAPTDVGECYELVRKAFEVAEAFQTPVLVLLDFFLSGRMEDIRFDLLDAGRWGRYEAKTATVGPEPYRRFALTEDGISPRSVPGMEGLAHPISGLEHDERGLPDYSGPNHLAMLAKRRRKLEGLRNRWPAPEEIGPEGQLEVGLISWGSTVGAVRNALRQLGRGVSAGAFIPRLLWPAPEEALRRFSGRCTHLAVAEANGTGQFATIVEGIVHRPVTRICEAATGPLTTKTISDATRALLASD
jgi:2-oxoglutarate/2-oxoacid ferredoxin oxidoreductase subunit alpha